MVQKIRKQKKPRSLLQVICWKLGHKVVTDKKKKQSKQACRGTIKNG